jgi:acetate kinase
VADVVAVLNAGSSSLKFSLYRSDDAALALLTRGQAEGLFTSPKFVAKDGGGKVVDEKSWMRVRSSVTRARSSIWSRSFAIASPSTVW